jgi:hypothetical protein
METYGKTTPLGHPRGDRHVRPRPSEVDYQTIDNDLAYDQTTPFGHTALTPGQWQPGFGPKFRVSNFGYLNST